MALQFADGGDVDNLLCIGVQREVLGDLPDEDTAIVGSGCNHMVVERVPVGVEDGCGVAAEERDLVRELAALLERDDCKCAATASLPVDRKELGVGLSRSDVGVKRLVWRSRAGKRCTLRI